MDTTCWHMNATLGGANLHPGVNLHPGANLHSGANCAYEHGLRESNLTFHKLTLVSCSVPCNQTWEQG